MKFDPLFFHKIAYWCYLKKIPVIPRLLTGLNLFLFNCKICTNVKFSKNVTLVARGLGVTIANGAKIGHNTCIGVNTVIVRKFPYKDVAEIGDNVFIGPGVAIVGPVIIEDNVVIGANSVITKSIPKNSIVAGNPAKIISSTLDIDYDIFSNPQYKEGKSPFLTK